MLASPCLTRSVRLDNRGGKVDGVFTGRLAVSGGEALGAAATPVGRDGGGPIPQAGDPSSPSLLVSVLTSPPPTAAELIPELPNVLIEPYVSMRYLTKATRVPSGEKSGSKSL
jgi:hypothetical protein